MPCPAGPVGEFGLCESDFEALGSFAAAGLRATELVLARAADALVKGRIPISGAVVVRTPKGELVEVTVGQNGRIPPPSGHDEEEDAGGIGYPTDHGETGALRQIQDASAPDWANAVFATSLSPCIMCFRSIEWLWSLGLRRVVIAESKSFGGTADRVAALDGMVLVRLCNRRAVGMMRRFARTFPWDWAADIGEVPPADMGLLRQLRTEGSALGPQLVAQLRASGKGAAVFVPPDGRAAAMASDDRRSSGGNEVRSAAMQAMGLAGSAVNLREAALAVLAPPGAEVLDMQAFGRVSLGACELFRPAALLTDVPVEAGLGSLLKAAGVEVFVCAGRSG